MSINIHKRLGFILAVAGAAVLGGATTAVVSAAIPSSSDGQLHGCYRNNSNLLDAKGSLRLVDTDANEACTAQETSVSWNQQGPKGDQGDPGPQGPQGPAGSSQPYAIGNQMSVNWGDIPEGGTPQKFLTIPGFGDIYFTRCDSNGVFEVEFRNTSGEPIRLGNNPDAHIMEPGEVLNSAVLDTPYYNYYSTGVMSKGAGADIKVAQQFMNFATSEETPHTCFYHDLVVLSYSN